MPDTFLHNTPLCLVLASFSTMLALGCQGDMSASTQGANAAPSNKPLVTGPKGPEGVPGVMPDVRPDQGGPTGPSDPTDPTDPMRPQDKPPVEREPVPARVWKLTSGQYIRSVGLLFGDDVAKEVRQAELDATLISEGGRFSNHAKTQHMSLPHVEALWSTSERLAAKVAQSPQLVDPCLATDKPNATCLEQFPYTFGSRAYRRPITVQEADALRAFFNEQMTNHQDVSVATGLLAQRVLLSPHFIYRTELGGENDERLSPFEVASALAYFLTNAPPDEELWSKAMSGELETTMEVAKQTRRLLASEGTSEGLQQFFREYYGYDQVVGLSRTSESFKGWGEALSSDLSKETERFIDHVLWQDDAKWGTLMTARYTMMNERVAKYYGIKEIKGGSWRKVDLSNTPRHGILTHGSLLAIHSLVEEADLVKRGVFVRENLLCQTPPPVPPGLDVAFPPPVEGQTQRQRLEDHSMDAFCASCHVFMDPLGYAFGHFDATGAWQEQDNGQEIDTTGYVATQREKLNYEGPGELAALLVKTPQARHCFVHKLRAYALGITHKESELTQGAKELEESFDAMDGNIMDLVVAVTTSDPFLRRHSIKEP